MKSLQEICDYIWVNEPACQKWDRDQFENWVNFHWSNGFVCLVLNVDESIAGLAMIRPVMVEDAHDPLAWDFEGNCLHVSQVISTAKGALIAVGLAVKLQFGVRDYVSWNRRPSDKLRIVKSGVLRRNLFRMETVHGQL